MKNSLKVLALTTIGLSLCSASQANQEQEPQKLQANKSSVVKAPPSIKQPIKSAADFIPDPEKRLTLEDFTKGLAKLHGYLKNAVEKANDEDKRFLSKEKLEIEQQMANPKEAYDDLFANIELQSKRLASLNIFPALLVAQMRKHYLETDSVKAMAAMRNESKKEGISNAFLGEMEYQLGIIAHRDQVNYKTALRHFNKAVQYVPGNFAYLNALGDVFMTLEDHGSAAKLYQELLTLPSGLAASVQQRKQIEQKLTYASKQWKVAQSK
jgi:tetratricopeptide (TPR) repeat protein